MTDKNSTPEIQTRVFPKDSKEAYFQTVGLQEAESLPDLKDLPDTIRPPKFLSDALKDALGKTVTDKKEHAKLITISVNKQTDHNYDGSRSSVSQIPLWIHALSGNTAFTFIHTHPELLGPEIPTESLPSSSDLDKFRQLNKSAFIFAIVNEHDTTLLIQTSKSMPPSLELSTTVKGILLQERFLKIKGYEDKRLSLKYNVKTVQDTIHRPEFVDEIKPKLASLLAEYGFGFYEFKGDIRRTLPDAIEFKRLN